MVELGPLVPLVLCDRCGQPADAERLDVSMFGDRARQWVWGRIECVTAGCVDETGSTAVDVPDVPGQLTREDRRWLRKHRALAEELAEIERRLLEGAREIGD